MTRDLGDGRTEVLALSVWDDREVIRRLAGEDIEHAVFYQEDDRFLVDREVTVTRYEVIPGG